MSYPQDYKKTWVSRHAPEIAQHLLNLRPGETMSIHVHSTKEAERWRWRLYAFIHAFHGEQRYIIRFERSAMLLLIEYPGGINGTHQKTSLESPSD